MGRRSRTGRRGEGGAGMVEYALLVGLVGIALIGAVLLFSGGVGTSFSDSASVLGGGSGGVTAPADPGEGEPDPVPGPGKGKGNEKGKGKGP